MPSDNLLPIYDDVAQARTSILKRQSFNEYDVPEWMLDSNERLFGERISPAEGVRRIIQSVRQNGDSALKDWSARLDRTELDSLLVPAETIHAALAAIPSDLREAMQLSAERIRAFHSKQPLTSWIDSGDQGTLGQMVKPVDSVGVYVPGGSAPLFSSLLMSVIPAQVAGVKQIVVCSPPNQKTGEIAQVTLAAAAICGVKTVVRLGGAQAIAAMAYGTESVPRVAKIVGAGGLFTVLAKQMVYGDVGIDGLPGPTETMVIADANADPALAAADLLAQAEHDVVASAILITTSHQLAEAVAVEIGKRLEDLSRADIIAQSLQARGGAVVVKTLYEAFEVANEYAAEHLCLLVDEPWRWLGQVRNAGGVFLGESSFEVLGDYIAGPSHIMPTGGTARFASPLNVLDFVKITSIIGLNDETAAALSRAASIMAKAEDLTAHAAAAAARLPGD